MYNMYKLFFCALKKKKKKKNFGLKFKLSSYILHACKISRWSNINNYVINYLFKCIKNEFIDELVNNIQLAWKLACMLRIYRTCNLKVRFLKHEFNNNLLGDVILLKITLSITKTQLLYIYIYIYI